MSAGGNMLRQFRESWRAIVRRGVDRRATRRVEVQLSISVQGLGPRSEAFCEEARTISINAHGGMMSLIMPVLPGQRLVVTNHGNELTQEAVIVWARPKSPSGTNLGFRFSSANPEFWANLEIGKQRIVGPSA
jgi:hypothetical protein